MDGKSSSLNIDYIMKQNFLSMGSNIVQAAVTIVHHMRYAKVRYMFQFTLKRRELKLFISFLF